MTLSQLAYKRWYATNRKRKLAANKKWRDNNKDYYNTYNRNWRKINGKRIYNSNISRLYNIESDRYDRTLVAQGNLCAICRKPETVKNRRLSVDHCHKTGNVRGILCMNCNLLLGKVNDSIDTLQSAIDYLKKYSNQQAVNN